LSSTIRMRLSILTLPALSTLLSASAVPATYDGTCYYPAPDACFPGLKYYTGRWYQIAGTVVPFTRGCKCIFAEYSLNVIYVASSHLDFLGKQNPNG
jgi:lipocalin